VVFPSWNKEGDDAYWMSGGIRTDGQIERGPMPEHKQVTIHGTVNGRSHTAEVDAGIADFIQLLWSLDIGTVMSCEDNYGRIWIDFPSTMEAERFLNDLAPDPSRFDDFESLDNRICSIWEPTDDLEFRRDRAWHYTTSVADYGLNLPWGPCDDDDPDIEREGEPCFIFDIDVRFPIADLPEVMERLKNVSPVGV